MAIVKFSPVLPAEAVSTSAMTSEYLHLTRSCHQLPGRAYYSSLFSQGNRPYTSQKLHQGIHFRLRSLPVLRRKSIHCKILDAEISGNFTHFLNCLRALHMTVISCMKRFFAQRPLPSRIMATCSGTLRVSPSMILSILYSHLFINCNRLVLAQLSSIIC